MLYTSKGMARWLCITDREVRNLRDQGVLPEVRPGVFDAETTVQKYITFKFGNQDDQVRLIAARAGTDLEDDVLIIVRVLRQ